jgi:hypothetical protein
MLGQNQFHRGEPKPACFDFSSSNFNVQGHILSTAGDGLSTQKNLTMNATKDCHLFVDPSSLRPFLASPFSFWHWTWSCSTLFSKDGWLQRCTCSTSQRKAPRTCVTSLLDVRYRRKQIKWGRTKWKGLGLGFQGQEVGSDSSSSSSSKREPRKKPIIVVLLETAECQSNLYNRNWKKEDLKGVIQRCSF